MGMFSLTIQWRKSTEKFQLKCTHAAFQWSQSSLLLSTQFRRMENKIFGWLNKQMNEWARSFRKSEKNSVSLSNALCDAGMDVRFQHSEYILNATKNVHFGCDCLQSTLKLRASMSYSRRTMPLYIVEMDRLLAFCVVKLWLRQTATAESEQFAARVSHFFWRSGSHPSAHEWFFLVSSLVVMDRRW